MAELDAWAWAAEAAQRSDKSAATPPEYVRMENVQDPHSYTAAADAAKKSTEDAVKVRKAYAQRLLQL